MKKFAIALIAVVGPITSAASQSTITNAPPRDHLIDEYVAYIGPQDLVNSNGVRLTAPWQIIRQDRANYHQFGRADRMDTGDTFFQSRSNRAKMEAMLASGYISSSAARDIVSGGVLVRVEIWGSNGFGRSVHVEVAR
ncbi:MAG: hypothetical protein KF874_09340 [Rhizobiaceae bacterium]|nr:hypothetical protein [Rhizobiaceae bacterium]